MNILPSDAPFGLPQARRPTVGSLPPDGVIPPHIREQFHIPPHIFPGTFVTWHHGEMVAHEYFSSTPHLLWTSNHKILLDGITTSLGKLKLERYQDVVHPALAQFAEGVLNYYRGDTVKAHFKNVFEWYFAQLTREDEEEE